MAIPWHFFFRISPAVFVGVPSAIPRANVFEKGIPQTISSEMPPDYSLPIYQGIALTNSKQISLRKFPQN